MASKNIKARCITCSKENATSKCAGCLQDFCYKHLGDHRQELSKQLDEVEVVRDLFRQSINEQKSNPLNQSLIQQIDAWEHDAIEKIRKTAEEAKQLCAKHTAEHFTQIETKLGELTAQLRHSREEEDFFESDLRQWNEKLRQLIEQLGHFSYITLRQENTPLVTKVSINVATGHTYGASSKQKSRLNHSDDDEITIEPGSAVKVSTRFKYNDGVRQSSMKSISRSKDEEDDDDNGRPAARSNGMTRYKNNSNDHRLTLRPTTRSNLIDEDNDEEDDDDDNDDSNYEDADRSSISRSKRNTDDRHSAASSTWRPRNYDPHKTLKSSVRARARNQDCKAS